MARFNVWSLVTVAFVAYIGHSLWTLYTLFHPPLCTSTDAADCLRPAFNPKSGIVFELRLYLSSSERPSSSQFDARSEIARIARLNLSEETSETFEVSLPSKARRNGTVWLHAFLLPAEDEKDDAKKTKTKEYSIPFNANWHLHQVAEMTTFAVPRSSTVQLMSGGASSDNDSTSTTKKKKSDGDNKTGAKTNHWRSVLTLTALPDPIAFDWRQVPGEIMGLIKLSQVESYSPENQRRVEQRYLPVFYLDELSFRVRDLHEIQRDTESINLTVNYRPVTVGKLRLLITAQHSVENLKSLGFSEKDVDEVKGIFTDTNFYFLALTFFVAAVHLLLDFLAFKNDVSFWRERKSMVGLSTRTVLWRCFSQFVVFLYLLDEETSLLVLIPAGIGALIELWKVTKAFKITINIRRRPFLTFGDTSSAEQRTDEIDSQGMKYLAMLMIPLCMAGAVYSLLYVPHKSWYSWFIQSTANGVYAFGFLFMLPQLFVNHKLKSVAHLPWRAFMYKAFNTFIDDMFAFIITMPAAHRMACFRDDIVFLVYLYQRYLYPVDKSRVNEYGEAFDDGHDNEESKEKPKEAKETKKTK